MPEKLNGTRLDNGKKMYIIEASKDGFTWTVITGGFEGQPTKNAGLMNEETCLKMAKEYKRINYKNTPYVRVSMEI